MTIGPIGAYGGNTYAVAALGGIRNPGKASAVGAIGGIKNPGESTVAGPGKKVSPAECTTCSNRQYQDGSDENVSFKSPTHISPEAAGAAVRAHEGEHVANAYAKAAQKDGKVIAANVSIKMSVCPECGRNYVAGGLTTTKIKYSNESNPYQRNKKSIDAANLIGMNLDLAV
ncbi:MAG: hypothetical protein LBV33_07155 [Lachnospiraceae bacterium]|jgi:hypothetical protein|nr:hypothetical protein [Lachnospiraceae bacterium]